MSDFGKELRVLRESLGLTATSAAERLGMDTRRTWEQWENSLRTPPVWCQQLVLAEVRRWKPESALKPRKSGNTKPLVT